MSRLSTWHLGAIAAAAVAAAIFVTVNNHDSHSGPRDAVAAYIKNVDGIQQRMRVPLTRVLQAYRDYAKHSAKPARVQPELAQAQRTLRTFGRRVRALEAPPEARRLRALLVQLADGEARAAGEVHRLALFTGPYRAVLGQSRTAGIELGKALAAAPVPQAHNVRGTAKQIAAAKAAYAAASSRAAAVQADAVDAYDIRLAVVLRRLRALDPPAAMAPGYRAQVRTFRALRRAGARLAGELRKPNRARVSRLGRSFGAAARLSGTVAAQRAEIAAIKAYNGRIRALGTLQGRVQTEVARLQRTLN